VSAVLNLVGAFLSLSVAATIASGLVDTGSVTLTVVLAGLTGGITWNLVTWFLGIPSSSSHALIGGVVGATLAAGGPAAVRWSGLLSKVIIPAALSPVIAGLIAVAGTYGVYRVARGVPEGWQGKGFRVGQIGSASLVSLAHGTNDAQKTMGVITLALITAGAVPADAVTPFWVVLACAVAISAGTYAGGWRVIKTLGTGLVDIESPQGMASESSSAATIVLSSHFGYSLSTTHVATGAILGGGLGHRRAEVRWHVAGRMASAWVITLPVAGLIGAATEAVAGWIGGTVGALVVTGLLAVAVLALFWRSRKDPVRPEDVQEKLLPPAPRPSAEPGATWSATRGVDDPERGEEQ
jgi:PiT family inorganic phosphate transporter